MNWNVKDASENEVSLINTLKAKYSLSSAGLLSAMLKKFTEVSPENTGSNPEKITELLEVNQQITTQLTEVNQKLSDKENEVNTLTTQLTELKNTAPAIELPNFIVTPTEKMALAIQMVEPGFYAKGFSKNSDPAQYRNELALCSIRYLIDNNLLKYLKL